jgi:hypothetical protein
MFRSTFKNLIHKFLKKKQESLSEKYTKNQNHFKIHLNNSNLSKALNVWARETS